MTEATLTKTPRAKPWISRKDRARMIANLGADGLASREIAKEMGVSHQLVCRVAAEFSIPLSRPGLRRFGLYIADRRAQAIRKLAAEAGVSPATMIERMTRVVLDDGLDRARQRLGKLVIAMEKRNP